MSSLKKRPAVAARRQTPKPITQNIPVPLPPYTYLPGEIRIDSDTLRTYTDLKIQRDEIDTKLSNLRPAVIESLKVMPDLNGDSSYRLELTYSKRPVNSAAKILEAVEPTLSDEAKRTVEEMRAKKYDCAEVSVKPNPNWKGGK